MKQESLSPERWAQVQHLFDEIVELAPAARLARLAAVREDDPTLADEAASLLDAYDDADDILQDLDDFGESLENSLSDLRLPETPSFPAPTGTTISHYEVYEKLGGGGMGVVYRALDTRLKRPVALKFLPPQWSQSAIARQRFEHEAQAASALDHPNICTIYDIGETETGQLYLAMAYYRGETLKKKIARGPLKVEDALEFAVQMARGLARAHEAGIIHRDVKPANIMVTDRGEVKILDFGLAKMKDVQLTQTGTTLGTVAYMSPEQARGHQIDHRTDLWSLGVVLYELLTGERPFQSEYDQALIYAILHEEPPPLREIRPDLPEGIEHVVALCLEKEPDLRYPSMADLVADLSTFVEGSGSHTATRLLTARWRQSQRRPQLWMGLGALLVLVVLVLALPPTRAVLGQLIFGPTLPEARHLAVLPFTHADGDSLGQAIAAGLEETLRSQLIQLESFQEVLWVVPESEMREYEVSRPDEARQYFGATLAVQGSVEQIRPEKAGVRLSLALFDTRSQRRIGARTIDADDINDVTLQRGLVPTMMDLLDLELSPQIRRVLATGSTTEPGAHEFYTLARGYLQRYEQPQQLKFAIESFERALREDPTYALAYAGLGEAYWRKYANTRDERWLAEAERYCDLALEQSRELAPVYVTLGLLQTERGGFGRARAMFDLALSYDPANADAYRGLATVFEKLNRPEKAEETYKRAIALKPDYWAGYHMLGSFYHRNSRYQEALEQFERIIELAPDIYVGYNAVGASLQRLNRRDEARAMYERALAVAPHWRVYSNLASLLYFDRDFGAAVRAYEQMLALRDTDYRIWGYLANAAWWSGQRDKARQAWQTMIEKAETELSINPRSSGVIGDLASAHAKLGEHEQALRYAERLEALQHEDTDHLFDLSLTYEVLQQRERALDYLRQAIEGGYPVSSVERHEWLNDLRTDPGYQEILLSIAARDTSAAENPK